MYPYTPPRQRSTGLGEAVPIKLTIDTPYQVVGGKPKFTLIGATPGAKVFWSSYKNGTATEEFNVDYGHVVEANGTAVLAPSDVWKTEHEGVWVKEVLVQDGDKNYRAMVQFQVAPAAAGAPPGASPTPSGGFTDILSQPLFSLGNFDVTVGIAGGALLAWYVLKRK